MTLRTPFLVTILACIMYLFLHRTFIKNVAGFCLSSWFFKNRKKWRFHPAINLPCGHVGCHKKFRPNRLNRNVTVSVMIAINVYLFCDIIVHGIKNQSDYVSVVGPSNYTRDKDYWQRFHKTKLVNIKLQRFWG